MKPAGFGLALAALPVTGLALAMDRVVDRGTLVDAKTVVSAERPAAGGPSATGQLEAAA